MKTENAVGRIHRTVRQRVPQHGLPNRVSRQGHGDRRGGRPHAGIVLGSGGRIVACSSVPRDRENATEKPDRMAQKKGYIHLNHLQKRNREIQIFSEHRGRLIRRGFISLERLDV